MTHTPTPWEAHIQNDANRRYSSGVWSGDQCVALTDDELNLPTSQKIANTHLIVRAVNNHERLIEALEDIVSASERRDSDSLANAIQYAAEALAAASGEVTA